MSALSHVISGTVYASKIVLIVDNIQNRSSHLLECIIRNIYHGQEERHLHIVNTDKSPLRYVRNLGSGGHHNMTFVNVFSQSLIDPMNLNNTENKTYEGVKYTDILSHGPWNEIEKNLGVLNNSTKSKNIVVIDSVSSLFQWSQEADIIMFIKRLSQMESVDSLMLVFHEDLHDERQMAALESIATCILHMEEVPEYQKLPIHGSYHIIQKRKNGKVTRNTEHYFQERDGKLMLYHDTAIQKQVEVVEEEKKDNVYAEDPDVTFNLGITEAQKEARDSVILPHMKTRMDLAPTDTTEESLIYIDDDDDAFEGSDPDDDLDI